ncbi:hypothetical protein MBLNU230_g5324t2 [Neophaeotheca triangularis]
MLYKHFVLGAGLVEAGVLPQHHKPSHLSDSQPDYYFQTDKPERYPGPTPTGEAAFLAESNPAPFASTTYIPPQPLETQVPIQGNDNNGNIFHLQGQLSHYFPNPDGFGVEEYSLPAEASIVQLNMLHRHGARYPTTGSGAPELAAKLTNYTDGTLGNVTFSGALEFLNHWNYKLGAEILVPIGKQELFDSGTLHQYQYGHLYPNDGSKILARSTTQDRMTNSAEYFLSGFFGLDWTSNATLLLQIESRSGGPWNNSLAGYFNCPNSNKPANNGGTNASIAWYETYLANATARLAPLVSPEFNWTIEDSYNAQSLCAYETVALGYSAFCDLFTYPEWQGYEYSIDLSFAGNNAFQSPTGRAIGIGYVSEILARLSHHTITTPTAQVNVTLDNNTATFPLNQTLNFDFSHDTNIMSILTAFGLTQFSRPLPTTHIPATHELIVSHLEPFAARLDIEIISTPHPLNGNRKDGNNYDESAGGETRYVHFVLNQRTIPLGRSFPACGERDDGWCELQTFLEIQEGMLEASQYEHACFGEYEAVPFGELEDGVPPMSKEQGVVLDA